MKKDIKLVSQTITCLDCVGACSMNNMNIYKNISMLLRTSRVVTSISVSLADCPEPGATVSDSITGHMPACKPKTAKSYFSAELGKPAAFLPPPRLHRTGSHTRPFFEDSKLVASHLHVTDDALILGKMWWQGTIELDFTEPHLFNPKQKLPRTAWHVRNCHRQRKPVTAGSHNFQSNM